jgi:hypothetical protein
MPTYKNVTSTRKELEGKSISPNQTVYSLNHYNEDEVQLLKVDDKPYYNPIIVSTVITKDETKVKIPQKDDLGNQLFKYAIHFYVEKGTVKIFYDSMENKPPLILYTGAKWNIRCFERKINDILVYNDSVGDFILYLIIEKLN